jgi:hypothetical protein
MVCVDRVNCLWRYVYNGRTTYILESTIWQVFNNPCLYTGYSPICSSSKSRGTNFVGCNFIAKVGAKGLGNFSIQGQTQKNSIYEL